MKTLKAKFNKPVKDILCLHEGLSITLEYRCGDSKFSNRKMFSLTEVEASQFLVDRIASEAKRLWLEIDQAKKGGER